MEIDFQEAFYEVDEILKCMPKEILDKIPNEFKGIIKNNKSITYYKEIKGLDNLEILKKETIVILALIYRDFLCDEEERTKILQEERKVIEEKYSYDNLFKKKNYRKNSEDICSNNKCTGLIEIKENKWYTKIINFFKKIDINNKR